MKNKHGKKLEMEVVDAIIEATFLPRKLPFIPYKYGTFKIATIIERSKK